MLRRPARLAALLVGVLLLAACEITIIGAPMPTVSGVLTAQTAFPPSPQVTGVLSAREVRYYEVQVPNARDLLYVEAEGTALQVSLRTSGNSQIGVSRSPRYFAYHTGLLSLADHDDVLEPASLVETLICLGPCVATRTAADTYLMRVENLSTSPRSFALLAYTVPANDPFEPNNTRSSAAVLGSTGSYVGAIEWLGDADWFVYTGPSLANLFLVFTPFDLDLGLELEFVDCPGCQVLDGRPGSSIEGLLSGDVLRVRSALGRAGPSGSSGYDIEIRVGLP